MGTRGLTAVYLDGEYKVAQYGQWDHYPSGQGITALEFCRSNLSDEAGRDRFKGCIARIRFVDNDEIEAMYTNLGIDLGDGWVSLDDAEKFAAAHPQIDRDMGAEVLDYLARSAGEVLLRNEIGFAGEGTWCEGIYLVDLDALTFEAYGGKPVNGGRFAAVGLLKSYSLDSLPSNERFIADCEPEEE
jgi:hypothetical protein